MSPRLSWAEHYGDTDQHDLEGGDDVETIGHHVDAGQDDSHGAAAAEWDADHARDLTDDELDRLVAVVGERLAETAAMACKPTATLELVDWPDAYDGERRNDAIVDGIIIPGRWTALGAPGKVGKSTLELAIGVALSQGHDPFDHTPRDAVVVLYCDSEMGRLDVVDRLRTLDVKPDQLDRFHYTDLVPKLDIDQGAARLLATVEAIGAEVVIIDGINGFVEGPENDDTTWRHMFENAIAPLKRAGVAVLSADNLGKDKAKGLRGSTVKVDKPDAVIIMSRTDKGVRLTTTHRRTIDYPDQQLLIVDGLDGSEPIRYRHADSAWPAGTADAVALLDDLNIPDTWGRGKVRERLADERDRATPNERDRFMVRNELLVAALAFRKKRVNGFEVTA